MIRGVLRKVAAMVFPWPAKSEREASITAARKEKERSQAAAGHASGIERQIERMAEQNHFAAIIARQIIRGDK